MNSSHIRIVGAGLIGTSLALALSQHGHTVDLDDVDPASLKLARDLLSATVSNETPALIVIATPPSAAMETLKSEFSRHPQSIFIDVSSVKNNLVLEVESFPEISRRFIGTHPMAGREVSGPSSAQADLFNGRAWILTPTRHTDENYLDFVSALLSEIGATTYILKAGDHDRLLARISHLPQIVSTALGAAISTLDSGLDLAGQGLRDMTRLASSDGSLWSDIIVANDKEVVASIDEFLLQIENLKSAIVKRDTHAIEKVFEKGNSGREKVSGKHGARPRNYSYVLVVIKDEPGALRNLFDECAQLNANIEDLSIEHSPQQETGLITLAFSPEDGRKVAQQLETHGWKVHLR